MTFSKPLLLLCAVTLFYNSSIAQNTYSLRFNGNEYVQIPNSSLLSLDSLQAFTVEFWVKNDPNSGNPEWRMLVTKTNHTGGPWPNNGGYSIRYGADGGPGPYAYQFIQETYNGFSGGFTGNNIINYSNWEHVAFVYDVDSIKIFKNGQFDAGKPQTGYYKESLQNLLIGTHQGMSDFLIGNIDEFRISSVARYNANFIPDTCEFIPDANTVVLFHFNEGTGTLLTDISGNGNNGTIVGAIWSTDIPSLNNCLTGMPLIGNSVPIYAFPNPFISETNIYSSNYLSDATLFLYDFSGRIVKQEKNISGNNVFLNCNNLSAGLYSFRLFQESFEIGNGKIIISK